LAQYGVAKGKGKLDLEKIVGRSIVFLLVVFFSTLFMNNIDDRRGEVAILMANVQRLNPEMQPFLRLIHLETPEVFVVQELDHAWEEAINTRFGRDYPYRVTEPSDGTFGIGLWSRSPILDSEIVHDPVSKAPIISARVFLDTGVIKIVSTHIFPPAMYDYSDDFRRSQFETLASLVDERTIVIGDMNTTPFQRVSVGKAYLREFVSTWSVIPIDHAYATPDVDWVNLRRGPDINSDHRPIILEIDQ